MTSNGMPINKIIINDIIKFIWATIIFLLWFLLKEWKVWENWESLFFQDYLSKQSINENAGTEETHPSAPDTIDLCIPKDSLCNKIYIIEDSQTIPYKNQFYTATYFINNNQIFENKIVDTIKKIEIKNDETSKRGYATRDTIVLNITPTNWLKEFQNLSIHELAHIFDLWVIQWNSDTKNKLFTEFNRAVFSTNDPSILFYKISRDSEQIRKKTATKKDFCSGYGMTNPFEDFAECFNLYINNQSFFKTIAKKNKTLNQKYNFIASILKGNYIEKNTKSILLVKDNNDRRPRDTTKL